MGAWRRRDEISGWGWGLGVDSIESEDGDWVREMRGGEKKEGGRVGGEGGVEILGAGKMPRW